MKTRSLLILLATVVAFAAFILLFEWKLPSSEERSELSARLFDLEAEDVARLTLVSSEGEIVLERVEAEEGEETAADWRITQPLQYPAESWQVDSLLRNLLEAEVSRTLEDFDPAAVGLEEPRASATIELGGGGRYTLEVGGAVPASSNMIARLAGQAVAYVIPDTVFSELEKPAGDWRRTTMFDAESDEVERVRLEGSQGRIELARVGDEWRLEAPLRDVAASRHANSLLSSLRTLRVESFVDEPGELADLGLDPPRARLEVSHREGELFVLEWGREANTGGHYARSGEVVFETAADLDAVFDRSVAEWRSRAWTTISSFDVDRIRIEDENGPLELVRDSGDWLRDGGRIDFSIVSDLLYAVTDAEAEQILSEAPAGPGPDSSGWTVTLAGKDGSEEVLRLVEPPGGGHSLATVEGRDAILAMKADFAMDLAAKIAAIREAEVEIEDPEPP